MAITGEIAQKARERIPATWHALASDSVAGRSGEELLQGRINSTKQRLFGTVVDGELEAATYDPLVIDYVGIMVALSVIPAGADYWASQNISHSAVGKNEQKTFIDRSKRLWDLHEQLTLEAAGMWPDVSTLIPGVIKKRTRIIGVADAGDSDNMATPDPFTFERPFQPATG